MNEKQFPNGFTSWQETHYEVVSLLILDYERDSITCGMYELAQKLTDKFEILNKDREWDGEFFEELESFIIQELEKL